jgi:hypothetical protein
MNLWGSIYIKEEEKIEEIDEEDEDINALVDKKNADRRPSSGSNVSFSDRPISFFYAENKGTYCFLLLLLADL